jgi:hypothetical protein
VGLLYFLLYQAVTAARLDYRLEVSYWNKSDGRRALMVGDAGKVVAVDL